MMDNRAGMRNADLRNETSRINTAVNQAGYDGRAGIVENRAIANEAGRNTRHSATMAYNKTKDALNAKSKKHVSEKDLIGYERNARSDYNEYKDLLGGKEALLSYRDFLYDRNPRAFSALFPNDGEVSAYIK